MPLFFTSDHSGQIFDCSSVGLMSLLQCYLSCFQRIKALFNFGFGSQPDSYRVGSIFLTCLVRIRCVCKPITLQIGVLSGYLIIVFKCYFRNVVLCKSVRDRFNPVKIFGLDLDVSKACTIGNFKAGLIF